MRAVAALLAVAIFMVDSLTLLQGAVAVLYVIVILLLAATGRFEDIAVGTAGCVLLTVGAYLWSHAGEPVGSSLVRALVSIAAIGITAFLALRNQTATSTLLNQARLLDLSHDSIFARDASDVITFWSKGAERLYGWPASEALGKVAHRLLQTTYPTAPEEIWAELMRTDRWEGELVQHRRSGTPVAVDSRWALQRGARGQPVAVLQTETDITERKKALDALTQSEQRYRTIFETSRIGILQHDWSGIRAALDRLETAGIRDVAAYLASNPDFVRQARRQARIIDVNAVTLRIAGVSDRHQFARTLDDLLHENDQTFARTLVAIARGDEYYEDETLVKAVNGESVPVLFGLTFPKEKSGFNRIFVFVVDITERRQAQEALLAAQAELAHATRVSTLGEISASIAHEVNQPLAAIVTNGEAALRWLRRPEPDVDEVTSAITRVIRDGKRASEIVSRIRGFLSKSSAQQAPIDVADVIEETVALVDRELDRHEVAVQVTLDELPPILGDRVQLQQVMINLMVNGIQAMAHNTRPRTLSVAARRAESGDIAIEVGDTGTGIGEADLERLFKPFFTTKPNGMGMGLAICRSTVEAHGGRLWATSSDAGAVFHFTLPAAEESAP